MSLEDALNGIDLFNDKASLFVSDDKMEAYLIYYEELDHEWLKIINHYLDMLNIRHGVLDEPEIDAEGHRVILARGTPPENGQDGYIETYPFPEDDIHDLLGIYHDKRVTHFIVNVAQHTVIARIIPPTEGKAGKNIFDEDVPPVPGKWPEFKLGEGVRVSEDGTLAVSEVTGKLDIGTDGRLSVLSKWVIDGSVDLSTGNIVFWGDRLVVKKHISNGMRVETYGDLEVAGNIEDQTYVKVVGDLRVGGIIRAKETTVFVSQRLWCEAIEYANVTVIKELILSNYILDATINVGGHLVAVKGKGQVAGGTVQVGKGATLKALGTQAHVKTVFLAGKDPHLIDEHKRKQKKVEELNQQLLRLHENFNRLKQLGAGANASAGKALRARLIEAIHLTANQLKEAKSELETLEKEINGLKDATIKVGGVIYANCIVGIENARQHILKEINSVVLKYKNGRIAIFTHPA